MGRRGRDGLRVLYLGSLAAGRAPAKRRRADASASRRRYSRHRLRLPPLTKGLALRPTPVTQLPWVRWGGQWRVRRGSDGEDTSAARRKQQKVPEGSGLVERKRLNRSGTPDPDGTECLYSTLPRSGLVQLLSMQADISPYPTSHPHLELFTHPLPLLDGEISRGVCTRRRLGLASQALSDQFHLVDPNDKVGRDLQP